VEKTSDMKFNRPFEHYWFDFKIIRFFNTLFYTSYFPTMTKMVQVQQKWVRIIVFNVTFNNISAISWWLVLLVEENWVPGEKSLTNFNIKCCIEYTSHRREFELTTLVLIGTDCIGSYKSNYHTITTTPGENGISLARAMVMTHTYHKMAIKHFVIT
jgi:hypothetical protein